MSHYILNNAEATLSLLGQWRDMGWIRPLDHAFAKTVSELCGEAGEKVEPLALLLIGMCSHQVGRGHVCLELSQLLDNPTTVLALPPDNHQPDDYPTPAQILEKVTLDDCRQALSKGSAVSDGEQVAPLVLADNRLSLWRFWCYEQQIEAGIHARLMYPTALDDLQSPAASSLRDALAILFAGSGETVDYQKMACALAARSAFSVITGGPGTGKTTTVVKLLAALQSVARATDAHYIPRIRLAAPTGKAAARLNESIAKAVNTLPLATLPGSPQLEDIPTKVTTLHRLLGSRPNSRSFRFNRDNPLLLDILVIDEASMVDVEMMAAVMEALPPSAQLILLGDKDQLASVDAGAVLGQLCARAQEGHYRSETADWLESITGQRVPQALVNPQGRTLDQAVAMLRKSYRFTEDSGIRTLAEAVNSSRLDAALLQQCRDGQFSDVLWLNSTKEQAETVLARHALDGSADRFESGDVPGQPAGYRGYLELVNGHSLSADDPQDQWDNLARNILQAFSEFQILCALRGGLWGVEGINALVANALQRAGLISRSEGWYSGRPVLITANDYNLGLMNGDIGIAIEVPDRDGGAGEAKVLRVIFPAGDGSDDVRWISPSRLQHLETVYAMTVHKSQGSEFAHCCLVLPDTLSPVLSRELVYTGITRARHWFSLVTSNAYVLREAVAQRVLRASGLFAEAHELIDDQPKE